MLFSLLLSTVLLVIIYSCISTNLSFLKTLLIYIILCEIRLAILIGGITFGIFLLSFGIYFFLGIISLLILMRIRDSWGMAGFIIFGLIIQEIFGMIISWLT